MAKVTIERTVEWFDTDAAGHQHHSCIVRFVEAAEAALLREHDLAWLFGETPRVRHEINYRSRLWFGETVTVTLKVVRLVLPLSNTPSRYAARRVRRRTEASSSPTAPRSHRRRRPGLNP